MEKKMKKIEKILRKLKIYQVIKKKHLHYSTKYHFISFPKTGRTWVRLMLGKYLSEYYELNNVPNKEILEVTHLHKYNNKIPKILFTHDDDPHLKKPEKIEKNKRKYSNKKVIFLVRDPRDVLVSLYYEFKKRTKRTKQIKGLDLNDFVKDKLGAVINFYNIWYYNKDVPEDFLIIRYEDLHEDTSGELKKIIKFINNGIKLDENLIDLAVNYAKFKNMRKMEKSNTFNSSKLKPGDKRDQKSFKTRKGKVGGYQYELDTKTIRHLSKIINNNLNDFFGY